MPVLVRLIKRKEINMSETIRTSITIASDTDYSDEQRRANSVAAALELIIARASSSAPVHLSNELNALSGYADQIQDALKVK